MSEIPNIRLSSEPHLAAEREQEFQDAIDQFNMLVTGDRDFHPIRILLRDDENQPQGGILADVWGGWLYIRVLWINEPLRGHGYGTQLLQVAEDEARQLGCRHAHLETFSFQASEFYPRFGYEIIATLEDYPPGHTKYYMRKTL
jgi:GNAT superfamily N-acetyltransferase